MSKTNKTFFLLIFLVLTLFVSGCSQIFSVSSATDLIQYTNEPIKVAFTTNIMAPEINVYFDNQAIDFQQTKDGDTYTITASVATPGILKIIISGGEKPETITIDVRKPYIKVVYDIPPQVEEGESAELIIETQTPQGTPLDVDSVEIVYSDPTNVFHTIEMRRIGVGEYATLINYKQRGNYIFKIYPHLLGFETKETTAITAVLATTQFSFAVYLFIGALLYYWYGKKRK